MRVSNVKKKRVIFLLIVSFKVVMILHKTQVIPKPNFNLCIFTFLMITIGLQAWIMWQTGHCLIIYNVFFIYAIASTVLVFEQQSLVVGGVDFE